MKSGYHFVSAIGTQSNLESFWNNERVCRVIQKDVTAHKLGDWTLIKERTKNNKGKDVTIQKKEWRLSNSDLQKNKPIYKLFLVTYSLILHDRVESQQLLGTFADFVQRKGLYQWIDDCSHAFESYAYDSIIDERYPIQASLIRLVTSTEYPDFLGPQVASEILRLGKRFSPFGNDRLAAEAYIKFAEIDRTNHRNDLLPEVECTGWTIDPRGLGKTWITAGSEPRVNSKFVLDRVQWTAYEFFEGWDEHFAKVKKSIEDSGILFTNKNAISCTCTNTLCKRVALESCLGIANPWLSQAIQQEIVEDLDALRKRFREINQSVPAPSGDRIVKMSAVPKNKDSDRLIGPASILTYHQQMKVVIALRSFTANKTHYGEPMLDHIPVDDQSVQRERAQKGSVDGTIATYDLSSASDWIRKSLIRRIYPNSVANDFLEFLPEAVLCGKKAFTLSCFAMMGAPLTFDNMKTLIYLIVRAASEYHLEVTGHLTRESMFAKPCVDAYALEVLRAIGVFGDDITCHRDVYELVGEFLVCCGLVVNYKKSCNNQGPIKFREACGGDYLNGIDITSKYWPRHRFEVAIGQAEVWKEDGFTSEMLDNLSTILALSKSIHAFSPSASAYLSKVCSDLLPEMTNSEVGSTNPDAWSEFPLPKPIVHTPYAHFIVRRRKYHPILSDAKEAPDTFMWTREAWAEHHSIDFDTCSPAEYVKYQREKAWLKPTEEEFWAVPRWRRNEYFTRTLERLTEPRDLGTPKMTAPAVVYQQRELNPKGCCVEKRLLQHHIPIDEVIQYYLYYEYLEKGPQYSSKLDELLHVSTRRSPNTWFGKPTVAWKTR